MCEKHTCEEAECFVCGKMVVWCEIIDHGNGKCHVCRDCLKQEDFVEIQIDLPDNELIFLSQQANYYNLSLSSYIAHILRKFIENENEKTTGTSEENG